MNNTATQYNEQVLMQLGLPNPRDLMMDNGLDYDNPNISWHYHIFAALSLEKPNAKILEVGTWDGEFAGWLSKIFPEGHVATIDIKDFVNPPFAQHNISRRLMDSTNMLNVFGKESFDFIWMDGSHIYPQSVIDFYQCRLMLKEGGTLCCDDIVKDGEYTDRDVTPLSVIDGYHERHMVIKSHRANWKSIAILR